MVDGPKIGLATIIERDGLILVGKRINSHGHNTWSFPGGHLEKYETFLDCSKRELEEETGLIYGEDVISDSNLPITMTNDFFKEEDKHYVTIFLRAKQISKKFPQIMEPDKCAGWTYMPWEQIEKQENLFLPVKNLIKEGYHKLK